ncbi:MAG: tetratricopeptide repeat protein [Pirellulaceae bacterium]
MPDSLSPITPAQRQRLQKLWEEARAVMVRAGSPPSRKEAENIHELLAECVVADPGNTVYLDALLMNLRQLHPKSRFSLQAIFSSPFQAYKSFMAATNRDNPIELLSLGPAALREDGKHLNMGILVALADACAALDLPQAEVRYLQEALHQWPNEPSLMVGLVTALMRQGRFDEARSTLASLSTRVEKPLMAHDLEAILNGDSSVHDAREPIRAVLATLQEAVAADPTSPEHHLALAAAYVQLGQFDEAEASAAKAQSLSGGDLAVREQAEEVALARLQRQVEIARRLVEHEPSPAHQQTLRRWEEELGRLELATLHARSERFPQDAPLKLEVAIRLKRAGNYSGAIQRLEEIAADHALRPSVLIELGECWQHLRQFEKALGLYSQAIAAAEEHNQSEPLQLALYRAGCLATAMQQTAAARNWLVRLVSLDPNFKDARQRMLLLDT